MGISLTESRKELIRFFLQRRGVHLDTVAAFVSCLMYRDHYSGSGGRFFIAGSNREDMIDIEAKAMKLIQEVVDELRSQDWVLDDSYLVPTKPFQCHFRDESALLNFLYCVANIRIEKLNGDDHESLNEAVRFVIREDISYLKIAEFERVRPRLLMVVGTFMSAYDALLQQSSS